MNRAVLHHVIKTLTGRISEQNQMLMEEKGSYSAIETDLMKKQCIELYEAICTLHRLPVDPERTESLQAPPTAVPAETGETQTEVLEDGLPDVAEPSAEPESPVITDSIAEPTDIPVEPIQQIESIQTELSKFIPVNKTNDVLPDINANPEPGKEDKQESEPQFVPVENKTEPPVKKQSPKQEPEKTVLDKIGSEKNSKTIHDHLASSKEEKELHQHFPNSKIASIPSAIDISKRFEIQNNLFGGQSHVYAQAIKSLDSAADKDEALRVFDSLAVHHYWNTEEELVKELKSLIYRKF